MISHAAAKSKYISVAANTDYSLHSTMTLQFDFNIFKYVHTHCTLNSVGLAALLKGHHQNVVISQASCSRGGICCSFKPRLPNRISSERARFCCLLECRDGRRLNRISARKKVQSSRVSPHSRFPFVE